MFPRRRTASAGGVSIGLVLVVTSAALSGCASATIEPATTTSSYPPFPSTASRQFLADARREIPRYDDSELIAAAQRACTALRASADWVPAARPLLDDDVAGTDAGHFLHTAINAYCPDQVAKAPFLSD